jgi:hypothetical protein
MPATSRKQQIAAAIAEHEPGKLFKRNRGLLSMKKYDLRKYAATKKKKSLKEKTVEMAQKGRLRMK